MVMLPISPHDGAALDERRTTCSSVAYAVENVKLVALLNTQRCIPPCIARIEHHAPVVIGCAIAPPGWSAFAQALFGCIDSLAGCLFLSDHHNHHKQYKKECQYPLNWG